MLPRFLFRVIGTLTAAALFGLTLPGMAVGNDADDPKWCRACHRQDLFSASQMSQSVHGSFPCRSCHTGYHFDPHEPVETPPGALSEALGGASARAAAALAACTLCHADVAEALKQSPHRRAGSDPDPATPFCLDCHGDPHAISPLSARAPGERRQIMNDRCASCHGDPERMEKAGLSTHTVDSYAHSMHARKLHLGSDRAPGCADCHGTHAQVDLEADRVETCGGCHEGAGETFASLAIHLPLTPDDRPVGYFTQKFFAWLTFVTIFFLALHILLDVLASIRNAWPGKRD
jgi:hypothetical protein